MAEMNTSPNLASGVAKAKKVKGTKVEPAVRQLEQAAKLAAQSKKVK